MKIQYCSDLHLEFKENKKFLDETPLAVAGDILILAGDIVPFAVMNKHKDFFNWLADNFEYTYWLPGNHEYYHSDIKAKSGTVHERIRDNVFLVNNHVVVHDKVRLLFSTLWSHISPENHWTVQQSISDFHAIKSGDERFNPDDFNLLHQEALQFIISGLKTTHAGNTLVATHHVPTLLYYPERFRSSKLNEVFATELHDLVYDSGADYWIYGHHHQNTPEFMIGNTHLVTNQLGYVRHNEQAEFETDKFIYFN